MRGRAALRGGYACVWVALRDVVVARVAADGVALVIAVVVALVVAGVCTRCCG